MFIPMIQEQAGFWKQPVCSIGNSINWATNLIFVLISLERVNTPSQSLTVFGSGPVTGPVESTKDKVFHTSFPHGMLDPWFKRRYPIKHIKKQVYWWLRQEKILRQANAVCFTTDEERRLARKTFWPYHCLEKLTGLGIRTPPAPSAENGFLNKRFQLKEANSSFTWAGFIPRKAWICS